VGGEIALAASGSSGARAVGAIGAALVLVIVGVTGAVAPDPGRANCPLALARIGVLTFVAVRATGVAVRVAVCVICAAIRVTGAPAAAAVPVTDVTIGAIWGTAALSDLVVWVTVVRCRWGEAAGTAGWPAPGLAALAGRDGKGAGGRATDVVGR
jgi:hypothetical protein